jgi:hypothetical protein
MCAVHGRRGGPRYVGIRTSRWPTLTVLAREAGFVGARHIYPGPTRPLDEVTEKNPHHGHRPWLGDGHRERPSLCFDRAAPPRAGPHPRDRPRLSAWVLSGLLKSWSRPRCRWPHSATGGIPAAGHVVGALVSAPARPCWRGGPGRLGEPGGTARVVLPGARRGRTSAPAPARSIVDDHWLSDVIGRPRRWHRVVERRDPRDRPRSGREDAAPVVLSPRLARLPRGVLGQPVHRTGSIAALIRTSSRRTVVLEDAVLRGAENSMAMPAVTRRRFLWGLGGTAGVLAVPPFARARRRAVHAPRFDKIDVYGTRDPQPMALPSPAEGQRLTSRYEGLTVGLSLPWPRPVSCPNMLASATSGSGCVRRGPPDDPGRPRACRCTGVRAAGHISRYPGARAGPSSSPNVTDPKALNGISRSGRPRAILRIEV